MNAVSTSNFGHLKSHDEQLVRLGMLAELYFPDDPNPCLLKLRQAARTQVERLTPSLLAKADG